MNTRFSVWMAVLVVALGVFLIGAKEHEHEHETPAPPRPAIPQPGETFTVPIPAARLSADGLPEPLSGEVATTREAAPPSVAPVVPWNLASKHVGETITAEGKVDNTHSTGKVCFLNFADNRDGFYVIIFEDAMHAFPEPPRTYLLHKTIRVTGQVYMHGGRPQIRVEDAKQIVIVPE